ncbi:MAG: hypothetical protein ACK4MF_08225, partial [Hyphomicrobiaceae bacterium]
MNAAVTPALDRQAAETTANPSRALLDRLLGIALMSLAPAVFWTLATWFGAAAIGFDIATGSLL